MRPKRPHALLDENAFESLLAHLDENRQSAGAKYEVLRQRLIQLLAWRGSWRPEELADETLNRAGRALRNGQAIVSLEAFCAGIARLLAIEDARKLREVPLEETHAKKLALTPASEEDPRFIAFSDCFSRMPVSSQDLILQYYGGEGGEKIRNREMLSRRLGIPLNTLRLRAYRIREALKCCIEEKLRLEPKDR